MTALVAGRDALAKAIRSVTDGWDEPLDEVHDVPQIVNALIASGALIDASTLACPRGGLHKPLAAGDANDSDAAPIHCFRCQAPVTRPGARLLSALTERGDHA